MSRPMPTLTPHDAARQEAEQLVCDWLSEVNESIFTPGSLGFSAKKFVNTLAAALLRQRDAALEEAAQVAENVIDASEQEFVKDPNGPWVLNSEVAKAIRLRQGGTLDA